MGENLSAYDRVRHRRDIHTNNIQFPGRSGIYEKDEDHGSTRGNSETDDRNK